MLLFLLVILMQFCLVAKVDGFLDRNLNFGPKLRVLMPKLIQSWFYGSNLNPKLYNFSPHFVGLYVSGGVLISFSYIILVAKHEDRQTVLFYQLVSVEILIHSCNVTPMIHRGDHYTWFIITIIIVSIKPFPYGGQCFLISKSGLSYIDAWVTSIIITNSKCCCEVWLV